MAAASGEVLIVDDTPENLQVLGAILRGEGLTVRLATSGNQALRSVAVRKPDLILLDIHMPGMNGLETCRRLKTDASAAEIPVLFLSATQEDAERLGAFDAGGLDFISKPFHAAETLARISTHLALSRLRRDLATANARLAMQVEVESQNREAAEKLAHERQVRLELALHAAGMGSWSSDPAGDRIEFDSDAQDLLGSEVGSLATVLSREAAIWPISSFWLMPVLTVRSPSATLPRASHICATGLVMPRVMMRARMIERTRPTAMKVGICHFALAISAVP